MRSFQIRRGIFHIRTVLAGIRINLEAGFHRFPLPVFHFGIDLNQKPERLTIRQARKLKDITLNNDCLITHLEAIKSPFIGKFGQKLLTRSQVAN